MKAVGPGILWLVATSIGIAVGMFVSLLVIDQIFGQSAGTALLGILVFGSSISLAQTVVLFILGHQKVALPWLPVTGIGFALFGAFLLWSDAFINVSDRALGAIQTSGGAISALLMFAVQWLVLRNFFRGAFWWLVASVTPLIIAVLVGVAATGGAAIMFALVIYLLLTALAFGWLNISQSEKV